METTIINITPAIAAEWLNCNTINRPLRRTVVDGYKSAYERGEYRLTHQGIAFADTNELLDGQHRLTAISEMGDSFSIPMMVTRGLPAEANKGIDQGLKRTHSDVLEITPGLAALARYMAVVHDTTSRGGITSQYLIPFIQGSRRQYEDLVNFCPKNTRTWSSSAVRAAAVLQMLNRGDADYIKVVYYSLNHAEFDTMPPIAQTLFRQAVAGSANVKGYDMFCRAFKVFDSANANMSKLQINDSTTTLSLARDIINRSVLGRTAMKKAPTTAGAKKPQANYTRVGA